MLFALHCLSEWLVLHVSKTKCVLFTSQRHKERDCILNLNVRGKSISCETTFKYLGVGQPINGYLTIFVIEYNLSKLAILNPML